MDIEIWIERDREIPERQGREREQAKVSFWALLVPFRGISTPAKAGGSETRSLNSGKLR